MIDIEKEIKEKDKIKILAATLKRFDLNQIYLLPTLRKTLDRVPKQRPFSISRDHRQSPVEVK